MTSYIGLKRKYGGQLIASDWSPNPERRPKSSLEWLELHRPPEYQRQEFIMRLLDDGHIVFVKTSNLSYPTRIYVRKETILTSYEIHVYGAETTDMIRIQEALASASVGDSSQPNYAGKYLNDGRPHSVFVTMDDKDKAVLVINQLGFQTDENPSWPPVPKFWYGVLRDGKNNANPIMADLPDIRVTLTFPPTSKTYHWYGPFNTYAEADAHWLSHTHKTTDVLRPYLAEMLEVFSVGDVLRALATELTDGAIFDDSIAKQLTKMADNSDKEDDESEAFSDLVILCDETPALELYFVAHRKDSDDGVVGCNIMVATKLSERAVQHEVVAGEFVLTHGAMAQCVLGGLPEKLIENESGITIIKRIQVDDIEEYLGKVTHSDGESYPPVTTVRKLFEGVEQFVNKFIDA